MISKNKKVTKVLIIGLTNKMGGVETFIYNTTMFSNKNLIEYDYLIHGYDACVFETEINNFYDGEQHIYFVPKYKKEPLKCIKALIKFYREHRTEYKYIHLQTGSTSEILYCFPYCLFIRPKVIVHSHNGSGSSVFANKLFQPVVNFISEKRFACSDVAAEWLFGKRSAESIPVINNGIDTLKYQYDEVKRKKTREEYGLKDELVIGHIGRFSEQKNHNFLIDIFAEVKKKKQNAVLVLVGIGELLDSIIEKVNRLGLKESVIFAGVKNNPEDYYCVFDIFVMPSLYEGLPIVGVEAQTSGLPCLFSENISKQVVLTDRVKLISINRSAKQWADDIIKVDKSLDVRNGYNKIVKKKGFDIKDAAKYLENVYLS